MKLSKVCLLATIPLLLASCNSNSVARYENVKWDIDDETGYIDIEYNRYTWNEDKTERVLIEEKKWHITNQQFDMVVKQTYSVPKNIFYDYTTHYRLVVYMTK